MKRILAMLLCLAVLAGMTAAVAENWTCPSCGKENDGFFCPWCGQKKPEQVACPKCGAAYPPDAGYSFCPACGASMSAGAAPEASADATANPEAGASIDGFYQYKQHIEPSQNPGLVLTPTGHALLVFESDYGVFDYQYSDGELTFSDLEIAAWVEADGRIAMRQDSGNVIYFSRYAIPSDDAERLAGEWHLVALSMGGVTFDGDTVKENFQYVMNIYATGALELWMSDDSRAIMGWAVDGEGVFFNWNAEVVRPQLSDNRLTVSKTLDDGSAVELVFER